jgi:hypothetical protein
MSANPANDPRERLNYFNGQRLAASDFRAEQGHHDGMRRVLNSSLYSSGIVTGLEVEVDPDDKYRHHVKVRRGLAFDYLGREIFLPEDVSVLAMGAPSTTKGLVFGNLLVISYREQRKSPVSDGCAVASQAAPCSGDLAWGAPTRIAADAVFEVLDSWPADESGKVVLAQLELNAQCQVDRVLPGARKYAMPVKAQQVRGVSLEGEKDIDQANPKELYFHVEGGAPDSVTLYLRARKFPSLYYTELGRHNHDRTMTAPQLVVPDHSHKLGAISTDTATQQAGKDVNLIACTANDDQDNGIRTWGNMNMVRANQILNQMTSGAGAPLLQITNLASHTHTLPPNQKTELDGGVNKSLGIDIQIKDAGVLSPPARATDSNALENIKNLKVFLDGQSITKLITDQLEAKPGQAGKWAAVDAANQPCIKGSSLAQADGSGEIDLLKLGPEIGLGQHKLEFRVDEPDVGGTIQYNLYVA